MTRFALFLFLAALTLPALAQSQPQALGPRVDRIEKELRAVQRKVFPSGSPAFTEPEIAAPAPAATAGQPAGAPLTELTARVDGLEREVARLTGQIEQEEHRLSLLSEQAAKDRLDFGTRLQALEAARAAAAPPPPPLALDAPPSRPGATTARLGQPAPLLPKTAPAPVRTAEAAPAPAAAPSSGDPAEDAYLAGYRLWNEKKYGEAATALKAVVAKYPKHKRASYAQNLLGRALLDDGKPANAAEAFATNYQTNPRGERAPDSLYYLGASLVALKKPADACKVYDEFDAAYGATAETALKDRVATARKTAKCK